MLYQAPSCFSLLSVLVPSLLFPGPLLASVQAAGPGGNAVNPLQAKGTKDNNCIKVARQQLHRGGAGTSKSVMQQGSYSLPACVRCVV